MRDNGFEYFYCLRLTDCEDRKALKCSGWKTSSSQQQKAYTTTTNLNRTFYDSRKSKKEGRKKLKTALKLHKLKKFFIFFSDKFCVFFAGSRHTPDYLFASKCSSALCVSAAVEQEEDWTLVGSCASLFLLFSVFALEVQKFLFLSVEEASSQGNECLRLFNGIFLWQFKRVRASANTNGLRETPLKRVKLTTRKVFVD